MLGTIQEGEIISPHSLVSQEIHRGPFAMFQRTATIYRSEPQLPCYLDRRLDGACTNGTNLMKERNGDKSRYFLGPYDVVCGRHKAAFNNVGNRRFRFTVSLALPRYLNAPTRKAKSLEIERIAALVHENGGHFFEEQRVQQHGSGGVTTTRLVELTQKQCHKKVGHALRDMALAYTARPKSANFSHSSQRVRMVSSSSSSSSNLQSMSTEDSNTSEESFVTTRPSTARHVSFDEMVSCVVDPEDQSPFQTNDTFLDDCSFADIFQAELE